MDKSMIDILFYISIVVFILGVIMLLVGYFGKNTDSSLPPPSNICFDFSRKTNRQCSGQSYKNN
jgi:hypothetical protein